eukprot:2265300-Prorocentrum_lima.AAC.1
MGGCIGVNAGDAPLGKEAVNGSSKICLPFAPGLYKVRVDICPNNDVASKWVCLSELREHRK